MNSLVKEEIERFYNNMTFIEGKSEKAWNKEGLSISLRSNPMKYFVLLISNKKDYDWFIHFENESSTPFTDEEKDLLFKEVAKIVKPGETVTTEGGVTPQAVFMH